MRATVLLPGESVVVEAVEAEGEDLWLDPPALARCGGWEVKPEGLCRGAHCVPVPPGQAGRALVDAGGARPTVNLTALARHMGQPVAASPEDGIWSIGEAAEDAADRLLSLEAPDFTLPDMDGKPHTLSAFRGRKVFLLAWASW
jgi:hypothetical protein